MKELTDKFWPYVRILILPYLFIFFVLFYPINYYILNPGGITPVENLITVNYNQDKEVTGSISSTYVIDINRPTFFEFMVGNFSPYKTINQLSGSNADYTNSEINEISYLDKATSVDASIYVAYLEAAKDNPNDVSVKYEDKILVYGKAQYLSEYDKINFGDQFIDVIGDDGTPITNVADIPANTVDSDTYVWHFKTEDGDPYTVSLTKDSETGKFGVTLKEYYLIDKENTTPSYSEGNTNIGGPSGGLMQTLAIYNMLVADDITHGLKIAGTGTINYDGSVGYIGAVKQKIATAYLNHVDVFFIPALNADYYYDNYQEALRACTELGIDPTGWLVPVSSFQDALDYLNGIDN